MNAVDIAPGHWLRADAAASYQRMRAAGMPAGGITDAGRTYAEQAAMYARYLRGELVAYAARPGTSKHETGTALDLDGAARAWAREHGRAFGWLRDRVAREPWHMEYVLVLDQRLLSGAATPAPIDPTEEFPMDAAAEARFDDTRDWLKNVLDAVNAGREDASVARDNAYRAAHGVSQVLNTLGDPQRGLAVQLARLAAEVATLRATGGGVSGVDVQAVADAAAREAIRDLGELLTAVRDDGPTG